MEEEREINERKKGEKERERKPKLSRDISLQKLKRDEKKSGK